MSYTYESGYRVYRGPAGNQVDIDFHLDITSALDRARALAVVDWTETGVLYPAQVVASIRVTYVPDPEPLES